MTSSAIELYLYMGSHDEIIKWLKSEGVKTRKQAVDKLSPYVKNLVYQSVGVAGSSLAGTANGSKRILDAFPDV